MSLPVNLFSFEEIKKAVCASVGETPYVRQILLVCDEVLANIVSYSGADSLAFACKKERDHLRLFFSDDGIPFDPTEAEPKEMAFDSLDSGGMGLSLIRKNVSSMTYERKNGRNELTLCCAIPECREAERRVDH